MKTQDAIDYYGSKSKVCDVLNIERQNATRWGYWLPQNHSQSLSFEDNYLEYDRDLFSGKLIEKGYVAAPEIQSTVRLLQKLSDGQSLFFKIDDDFIEAVNFEGSELIQKFKSYPVYKELTT